MCKKTVAVSDFTDARIAQLADVASSAIESWQKAQNAFGISDELKPFREAAEAATANYFFAFAENRLAKEPDAKELLAYLEAARASTESPSNSRGRFLGYAKTCLRLITMWVVQASSRNTDASQNPTIRLITEQFQKMISALQDSTNEANILWDVVKSTLQHMRSKESPAFRSVPLDKRHPEAEQRLEKAQGRISRCVSWLASLIPYPGKSAEHHYSGLPQVHLRSALGLTWRDAARLLTGYSSDALEQKVSVSAIINQLQPVAAAGDGTSIGLTSGPAIVFTQDSQVAGALFRANTSRVSTDGKETGPFGWTKQVLGNMVFTANGPLHAELLRTLKNTVRDDAALEALWPAFQQYAEEFVAQHHPSERIDDFPKTLGLYSMRGFGMVAGFPLNDDTFNEAIKIISEMMSDIVKASRIISYEIFGRVRGASDNLRKLSDLLLGSPDQIRPILENPNPRLYGKSFLIRDAVSLLNAKALPNDVAGAIDKQSGLEAYLNRLFNTPNDQLPQEEAQNKQILILWLSEMLPTNISQFTRENLPGILIAGFETTSLAMFWLTIAFQQLSSQDQHTILLELRENKVAPGESLFTMRLENAFPTFFRFFYETMRLYTVVPNLSRIANEDIDITVRNPHFTVRKGDFIIFSSDAMHHDSGQFSSPDELNIHRDASENQRIIPFGFMGAGNCPGFRFSLVEIVAYFSAWARRGQWPTIQGMPKADLNTSRRPIGVISAIPKPVPVTA